MEQVDFVGLLGSVFEETPAIAAQAWRKRPFHHALDLHEKMVFVVQEEMTSAEKIKLIQAHPELGKQGQMAEASVQEQKNAGLSQLTPAENQRIQSLNSAYFEKFGFPFVMAVKGFSQHDILAAFETRIKADRTTELARSLSEIYKIAQFRLNDLIG